MDIISPSLEINMELIFCILNLRTEHANNIEHIRMALDIWNDVFSTCY